MIVVKIELHSARTRKITQLGEMHISNNRKTTLENPKKGSYRVEVFRKPDFKKVHKEVLVENWSRHSKTVWQLVLEGLSLVYPKVSRHTQETCPPKAGPPKEKA